MNIRDFGKRSIPGLAAGGINGLFGAGGGMLLVPLLRRQGILEEAALFPGSLAIMLPICLISLGITAFFQGLPLAQSLPYLLGSALGGFLASRVGHRIPVLWLHRLLGVLILWGGVRYLWHTI